MGAEMEEKGFASFSDPCTLACLTLPRDVPEVNDGVFWQERAILPGVA